LRVILVFRHGHWHSGASASCFVKLGKEILLKCDLLFDFERLKL